MSFTLVVQFTGLCLHVVDTNQSAVAVLLPDGRFVGPSATHPDDDAAVSHAGYLRIDLANLALASPNARMPVGTRAGRLENTSDGPFFETIYRFGSLKHPLGGGQTLDFGIGQDGTPLTVDTGLPDLDQVAPNIPLLPGLFTKLACAVEGTGPEDPPVRSPLLLRTVLNGGTLKGPGELPEEWAIERRLNQDSAPPIVAPFSGEVTWTRPVSNADELTITLTDFDGSNEVKIPLAPVNREIHLKVANLCSDNPLEWDSLLLRSAGLEDSDFKWFYQLLDPLGDPADPARKRWKDLLKDKLLPAPRLVSQPFMARGNPRSDCAGATKTSSFPPLSTWST